MPRIEPLFPEVALQHEKKYGADIHEFNEGYFFAMPVKPSDDVIDLSFLEPSKPLHIDATHAMKNIKIVVAEGMEVTAADLAHRQYKVEVEADTGSNKYKARGMVYRSGADTTNINCKFDMKVPKSPAFDKIQKDVKYFGDIMSGDYAGKIACRHFVMGSVLAKQETYATGAPWRASFNAVHKPDTIQGTYSDFIKAEVDFYDLFSLSENIYEYEGGIERMPEAFAAMLQIMKSDAQLDEKKEIRKDFVATLRKKGSTAGGHVMHVSLKVNKDGDDKWLHKVKVYDPNETFIHRSMASNDLGTIARTEPGEWLSVPMYQFYTRTFDDLAFYEVKDNWKSNPNGDDMREARNLHELILDGNNPYPLKFTGKEPAPLDIYVDVEEAGLLKTEPPQVEAVAKDSKTV